MNDGGLHSFSGLFKLAVSDGNEEPFLIHKINSFEKDFYYSYKVLGTMLISISSNYEKYKDHI